MVHWKATVEYDWQIKYIFVNNLSFSLSQTFAQSTYDQLSVELNRQVTLQDLNEITDPEEFLQTQVIPVLTNSFIDFERDRFRQRNIEL